MMDEKTLEKLQIFRGRPVEHSAYLRAYFTRIGITSPSIELRASFLSWIALGGEEERYALISYYGLPPDFNI